MPMVSDTEEDTADVVLLGSDEEQTKLATSLECDGNYPTVKLLLKQVRIGPVPKELQTISPTTNWESTIISKQKEVI